MATAEELLAGELIDTGTWFEVDLLSRRITIPKEITNLGAKGDEDFMRARFKLPRFYYDIDFADFELGIDYTNAEGEEDRYEPKDVVVGDDAVTFTWIVGRHAALYNGNVTFGLCAKRLNPADPDDPFNEFHTTKASLPILDAMETCGEAIIEHTDLLEQWRIALFGIGDTEEQRIKDTSAAEQEAIANEGARVLATIPVDYQTAVSMTDNADRTKADAIICSAQGEVITVSDSSDDYIRGLKIFGHSMQNGTPTPDAPVDIVSVENAVVSLHSKNLLKPKVRTETINGVTFVVDEAGVVTANGTATKATYFSLGPDLALIPEEKYILSGCPKAGGFDTYMVYIHHSASGWDVYDKGEGIAFTARDELSSPVIVIYKDVTVNNLVFRPMIRLASFGKGDYELYKGQSVSITNALHGIPVSSGGNYTDANGQQWICDEIDFERGVYVQRVGEVNASELTFTLADDTGYPVGESQMFRAQLPSPLNIHAGGYRQVICSKLPYTKDMLKNDIHGAYVYLSGLYCRIQGISNLESFNSLIADAVFQVPLVTPIETPLSAEELAAFQFAHTNFPNTTVINNAGAWMELKYNADTMTYLDSCFRPTDEQVETAVDEYLTENDVGQKAFMAAKQYIDNYIATGILEATLE